ncbi:MAG TPA: NADP-dependent phosphogluconate dehydrogenase [bacterium]
MDKKKCDLGMIGLGVMGRNLLLNMADHGYAVIGYNKDRNKVAALLTESGGRSLLGATSLSEFIPALRHPRAVMMLVPAGAPVDAVISDLLPYLESGDILIDGGNSFFRDTERRMKALEEKGIHFLGMGVSGGEWGARHGPSMMPGGPAEAYARVRPIFESIAAKVKDEPCIAYLGSSSAGHYVKMVHNGIEYGLMQLIAETYDLLRGGINATNDELADIFGQWNEGELRSYLIEITARIFRQKDDKTDRRLVDMIADSAGQKGTGSWMSEEAMALQIPIPTIDVAVAIRNLSAFKKERELVAQLLGGSASPYQGSRETLVAQLRGALYAAMILTYGQGMALLSRASQVYNYNLKLEDVARIWRGGCIIRAELLEKIRAAYQRESGSSNLLTSPELGSEVKQRIGDLRAVVSIASQIGVPAPALMVSLAYLDAYRSRRLPTNLIQAQRDYFGSHTYERVDQEGSFHTLWNQS